MSRETAYRVDRIDAKGNITEHLVTTPDNVYALCGVQLLSTRQLASGNRACRRCQRIRSKRGILHVGG